MREVTFYRVVTERVLAGNYAEVLKGTPSWDLTPVQDDPGEVVITKSEYPVIRMSRYGTAAP